MTTYKTFLMKKASTGNTYEKLVDIKTFPDMGGEPELLETTTLSDKAKTYEPGLQDQKALQFDANYNLTDYTKLKALDGIENEYAVWFGGTETGGVLTPTGSDGKYKISGKLSVWLTGGKTNEVVSMKISIAPSKPITEDTTSAS